MSNADRAETKIRNLLAKANGGTTEEFATAMRIAVQMANQHGIDLNKLQGSDAEPEWTDASAPVTILPAKTRAPKWERYLVQGLAKHLGCFAYTAQKRTPRGTLTTSEVAHGQISRVQTLKTLANIWSAETTARAKNERRKAAFCVGFVHTVLARLADNTHTPAEKTANSLVPVQLAEKSRREVEQELARQNGKLSSQSGRVDAAAYQRGASAAENATMPGEAAALKGQLALR